MKDQVYIVTGATSGMGREIAHRLAEQGASLVLSGRDSERGAVLKQDVTAAGANAVFLAGDVTDIDYNQQLVATAVDQFGSLDGVVTNAGKLGIGSITDVTPEEWHSTFETNVYAVYYLLKHALPALRNSAHAAVVVNASIAAYKSFPNHPAYCASKAALLAFARQAARDYGPVRINSICPGPVDTPMIWNSAQAFPDPGEAVAAAGEATLMKRLGQPHDIAALVLFLLSDQASWITGSAFTIDGGALVSN